MSRMPSEATQLRTAKSEIKRLEGKLAQEGALAREFRVRATKAEQEVAEWKERFDILLRRDQPGEQT